MEKVSITIAEKQMEAVNLSTGNSLVVIDDHLLDQLLNSFFNYIPLGERKDNLITAIRACHEANKLHELILLYQNSLMNMHF